MNYEDRVTKEYIENAIANAGVKMVTGTYTGDGAAERTFSLGFTPRAVIVRVVGTADPTQVITSDLYFMPVIAVTGTSHPTLTIVEGGFRVNKHNFVNADGVHFLYIAFA